MGELIGAAVITFILIRGVAFIHAKIADPDVARKSASRGKISPLAYVIVLAICTGIGQFNFGFAYALGLYGAAVLLWWIVDQFRKPDSMVNPASASLIDASADRSASMPTSSNSSAINLSAGLHGAVSELERRLIELKRLRDSGLISEEEYQEKRRTIVASL